MEDNDVPIPLCGGGCNAAEQGKLVLAGSKSNQEYLGMIQLVDDVSVDSELSSDFLLPSQLPNSTTEARNGCRSISSHTNSPSPSDVIQTSFLCN
jgi:hypothetical protein